MRRSSRLIGLLALVVMALWLFPISTACAQEEAVRPELQQTFDAAVRMYEAGEYAASANLLDELIQMQPNSLEALAMREKAGIGLLVKMLNDPETRDSARLILRRAEERAVALRRDPETIKQLVAQMGDQDVIKRFAAIRTLTAIGPFAVPYLLDPALSNEPPEVGSIKMGAVIALRDMGFAATLPLAEAMVNADDMPAARIAGMLAAAPDARSVPELAGVAQSNRAQFVRQAAEKALSALNAGGKSAGETYYELAQRYYYNDAALVELNPQEQRVLWRWNPEGKDFATRLYFVDVPMEAYPRLRAQELLLRGMRNHDAPAAAVELYISNNYMQLLEGAGTEARVEEITAMVPPVNERLGAGYLYMSLGRALKDNNTALAATAIAAIRSIGDSRVPEGPNSLVEALAYPDKMVRAAAAETLMHLSPTGDLGGAEEAVAVLAAGLGARVRERILVLTGDDTLWQFLGGAAQKAGMKAEGYSNIAAAVTRAKDGVPPANLMILDMRVNDDRSMRIVTSLGGDIRSETLPIILMAEPDDVEKLRESVGGNIVGVLPLNVPGEEFVTAVQSAVRVSPSPAAEDIRSNVELVKRALGTLSALPSKSAYPAGTLSAPVSELLVTTDAEMRSLALKVIANFPDPMLRERLFDIFASENETPEMRADAGDAFLSVLELAPNLNAEQVETLRTMTNLEDETLRWQAIHALAVSAIPQAQRETELPEIGIPAAE